MSFLGSIRFNLGHVKGESDKSKENLSNDAEDLKRVNQQNESNDRKPFSEKTSQLTPKPVNTPPSIDGASWPPELM